MTIRYLARRTKANTAENRASKLGVSMPAKPAHSGPGPHRPDARKPIRKRPKRSKGASANEPKRDFKSS